ncbi:MAG: ParA family protein [Acidobacteriota bacterium]
MIVTVANFKGGVAKTTTAIHLAAYLHGKAPTVLLDGDPNRSAMHAWNRRKTLPFEVADIRETARKSREYEHLVLDTEARPGEDDFKALAQNCDMLVIPTTPGALDTHALVQALGELNNIPGVKYRILLAMVPPQGSGDDARELRTELTGAGVAVFAAEIPQLKAFRRAASQGVVVNAVTDDSAARGWKAYEAVAIEMVAALEGKEVPA